MVGLAPKLVRLDPKLDKSGTFSEQVSVHLAHRGGTLCFDELRTVLLMSTDDYLRKLPTFYNNQEGLIRDKSHS